MTADPYPDILTLLRAQAAAQGAAPALIDPDSGLVLTYADLARRTEGFVAALGRIAPAASRVALVLPNGIDLSCALLGAACRGTALPFNPDYTEPEFAAYFAETGAAILLTPPGFAPAAERAAAGLGIAVADPGPLLSAPPPALPPDPPLPDSVAMVLLTSGSTGRAKRVPLTHRNVLTSARDVCRSIALGPQDRCLSLWHLFHVGGLVDLLLAPLHSGGSVVSGGSFAPQRFFDLTRASGATWVQVVPAALAELMARLEQGEPAPNHSLRLIRSVAAALSPRLMEEVEARFGVPVITTFGMTEAGPLISSTDLPPALRILGSVGRSCGTEIGIFAPDWTRQPDGAEGEVAIRGPNVFAGYEGDPEANAAAFQDGWFRTGDLGRIGEGGHLFLTGRSKELVNRGGEKVNLREIDDALALHPAVAQAAGFAVPHPSLGEDVAAAIVLRSGLAVPSNADLRAFLGTRLAAFKVPRRILVLASLPRNAVGKVDRKALVALAADLPEADTGPAPTDGIEARIAAIWARELKRPSVGLDADFVALGGDSLSAVRMFLAVEEALGCELPQDLLARLTTVRALAAELQAAGIVQPGQATDPGELGSAEKRAILAVIGMGSIPLAAPGSALKVLNPEGRRPPLVWFFNAPADTMPLFAAGLSPDQPMYGGFSGGKLFPSDDATITRIARFYAAEIMERFPQGELMIGGNCKGGQLGWKVSQILVQSGRTVSKQLFLEYASPDMIGFPVKTLLMFGNFSHRKVYRALGPTVVRKGGAPNLTLSWVLGTHGDFDRPASAKSVAAAIRGFLEGAEQVGTPLASPKGRRVLALHKIDPIFLPLRAVVKAVL